MKVLLARLVQGHTLSVEEAVHGFNLVMSGRSEPAQTGALLAMIAQRGPTADELVGAATVMRQKAVPVAVPDGLTVVDTCGAGGTGSSFFNISTTAALVTAAAGRPRGLAVAKHGNRSVTSKSGSSNVLEHLGVNLKATPAAQTRCLDEAGMCFCYAPAHHPAMKHAGPVRATLGFATLFNLIGPLTNPAGARRQLIGVPSVDAANLLARALLRLDAERVILVHSVLPADGDRPAQPLGELTTFGPAHAVEVHHGQTTSYPIDPAALGLPFSVPGSVTVEGPADSARLVERVLDNQPGPARDIVVLNAGAALLAGGAAPSLEAGIEMAAQAVGEGKAREVLEKLVALTNG